MQKLGTQSTKYSKKQVLEHRAANFYDMKPLKGFILPQCQSPRLKNNAIRRGNLTPLFLKRSQVLTVCRLRNNDTLKHRTLEHFCKRQCPSAHLQA